MNKLKALGLIFLIFSGPLSAALSSQEISLTLEEAWNRMAGSNGELIKLRTALESARRQEDAPDQWIPSLSAGASLSRSSPLVSAYTQPDPPEREEQDNWSVRGSVDMQLRLSPGLSLMEKLEVLRRQNAELALREEIASLRYDLTVLFHQILAGDRRIAFQEENVALAETRLGQIQLQFDRGLRSDLELLSARIAAAGGVPGLMKERSDQEKRYITLKRYLGLEQEVSVRLESPPEEVSSDPPLEELMASLGPDPSIVVLQNQLEISRISYDLEGKSLYGPTLGMSLGWSSSVNPAFREESWSSEEWSDSLGLGFSLSVPLDGYIKGSSGQMDFLDREDAVRTAEINLETARQIRRDNVHTLYLDIQLSRANIDVDKLNVSLLAQTLSKMELSYSEGRASLSELEESRQDWMEAVLTLEDERLNLKLLEIELVYYINPYI